ncbi:MAG: family 43 glycosylhydrolase [Spirochaetes bacterium]|nr:family 43 glycosylhydrolase [Spirochaetota bacterium]
MNTAFHPGAIWPDNKGVHINAHGGGVLAHQGTYYWFGEHKVAGEAGNKAEVGVHCYSSIDLYNWSDEGIALAVSDDPKSDITRGSILERPKVIYNELTATFVMWFHLELKDQGYRAARAGVAISKSPAGPYTYLESFRPNAGIWPVNVREDQKHIPAGIGDKSFSGATNDEVKKTNILGRDFTGGQMARDMNLFVDDDGTAYHMFASEENSTMHISELTKDYRKPAGRYVRVFEHRWMEAPALFKRNGRYYMIASDCTGWAPNAARSMSAASIFGPWTELGNPCSGVNPENGMGPEKTFGGQSTCVLQLPGRDAYIAMFDIWRPKDAIDGRYVWLPIEFTSDGFRITWRDSWDMAAFTI